MNSEHDFCRQHLKIVMSYVRDNVESAIVKHAWGYKFSDTRMVEFQINACPELPDGYYWCGRGCCVWAAKAEGWTQFLKEKKTLVIPTWKG